MPADPALQSPGSAAAPDGTGVGEADPAPAEATTSASATADESKLRTAARIARIRAALLSGTYRVDLDKLAETILKNGVVRTGASDPDL